ncbi:MAG: DUF1699 family protein [Eubacteriales bacterium]
MRIKIVNKKNLDSHHAQKIIHLSFRFSYKDIATVIDCSPNLQAIQVPPCAINNISKKSKELLNDKKIIILNGNMRICKVNYDGCVVIDEDMITWDRKFLKMSDEALCAKYQIDMELLHYIFSKYSSHDIFIYNTKLFLINNKIVLVAIMAFYCREILC